MKNVLIAALEKFNCTKPIMCVSRAINFFNYKEIYIIVYENCSRLQTIHRLVRSCEKLYMYNSERMVA